METEAQADDPEVEVLEQKSEAVAEITEEQHLLDDFDQQVKHSGITPQLLADIERRLRPVFKKSHDDRFALEMKSLMSRENTTEEQVKDLVQRAYQAVVNQDLVQMEQSKDEEAAGVQRDDRSSRDVQAAAAQVPKGTGQTWRTNSVQPTLKLKRKADLCEKV